MIFWLFQAPNTAILAIKFVSSESCAKKIEIKPIWKVCKGKSNQISKP